MRERQERPPGWDASIALMHRWCIKIVCFSGLTWISFYCNAVNSLNWKKFRDFESREQVFFSFASVVTKLTTQKTLFLEILKQGLSFWPSFQLSGRSLRLKWFFLNLIWYFSSRFIEKLRFSRNRFFDPIMEVIETNMESDVSKRKDIDKVKEKSLKKNHFVAHSPNCSYQRQIASAQNANYNKQSRLLLLNLCH